MDKTLYQFSAKAVGLLLLIWLLSHTSIAQFIDGKLYDLLMKSVEGDTTPLVLKIDIDPYQHQHDWAQIINSLFSNRAKHIVFSSTINPIEANKISSVLDVRENQSRAHFISHTLSWQLTEDNFIKYIPSPANGQYRSFRRSISTVEGDVPTIATQVSNKLRPTHIVPDTFGIHFQSQKSPLIQLEQLISEDFFKEIVEGKIILIGQEEPHYGLHTPMRKDRISLLQYESSAIETLINGRSIQPISSIQANAIFLVLTALTIFLLQRIKKQYALTACMIAFFVFGLCSLLYSYMYLTAPFTFYMTSPFAIAYLVKSYNNKSAKHKVKQSIKQIMPMLKNRQNIERFYENKDHWQHLSQFLSDMLNCKRSLIINVGSNAQIKIVSQAGEIETQEIELANLIDPSTLQSALKHNGVLRLNNSEPSESFLIPLLYQESRFGYWLFELREGDQHNATLLQKAEQLAEQAARVCYFQNNNSTKPSVFKRLTQSVFNTNQNSSSYESYTNALETLGHKIRLYGTLLSKQEHGVLAFDLFGRVIHVNQLADDILSEQELNPFKQTASEILQHLYGIEKRDACQYLSDAVINKKTKTFIQNNKQKNINNRIKLKLSIIDSELTLFNELLPFHTLGILFELSYHQVEEQERLKEEWVTYATNKLHERIETEFAANDYRYQRYAHEGNSLHEIRHISEKINTVLLDQPESIQAHIPINVLATVREACSSIMSNHKLNNINLNLQLPDECSFCCLSKSALYSFSYSVLEVLLQDCVPGNSIRVAIKEDVNEVNIEFSSNGMGIPENRLNEYLNGNEKPRLQCYENLREQLNNITQFHAASVYFESDIGKGIKFKLAISSFL